MVAINLKRAKEIAGILGIVATAIAAIWGAFKPEKKAEAVYAIAGQRIEALESEVNNLYDLTGSQQNQIGYLLNIISKQSLNEKAIVMPPMGIHAPTIASGASTGSIGVMAPPASAAPIGSSAADILKGLGVSTDKTISRKPKSTRLPSYDAL